MRILAFEAVVEAGEGSAAQYARGCQPDGFDWKHGDPVDRIGAPP